MMVLAVVADDSLVCSIHVYTVLFEPGYGIRSKLYIRIRAAWDGVINMHCNDFQAS